MKEKLKEKYYIRYMDDFLILHPDKKHLQKTLETIMLYLRDQLELKLNKKTSVFPVKQGIDFLGYRIYDGHKLLRKRYVKRTKRMIKHFEREYMAGRMNLQYIQQVLASWKGRAERANVPLLRSGVAKRVWFSFGIDIFG